MEPGTIRDLARQRHSSPALTPGELRPVVQ